MTVVKQNPALMSGMLVGCQTGSGWRQEKDIARVINFETPWVEGTGGDVSISKDKSQLFLFLFGGDLSFLHNVKFGWQMQDFGKDAVAVDHCLRNRLEVVCRSCLLALGCLRGSFLLPPKTSHTAGFKTLQWLGFAIVCSSTEQEIGGGRVGGVPK